MDDQDVAVRSTRYVLADAAAEQPLEKAGFAGADDDQLGLTLFGGVDKLLRRLTGDAGEFDLQVGVGEQCLHALAMLFPQLLVALHHLIGVAGRICGVRHQTERARYADLCERLWRSDADDHHLRGEGARVLGRAPEGVLGGRRPVVADDDRLLRSACGLGTHRRDVFPHDAAVMLETPNASVKNLIVRQAPETVCKGSAVSDDSGWRKLLEWVSADVVEAGEFEEEVPVEAVAGGWLGSDGATAEEITAAEMRLGVELPPSYRAFLSTTNGFGPVGFFVRRLRPIEELVWLRDEDPELIAIWADETQESELAETLAVSDEYDGARVLLNPTVVDDNGDWEAWFFAHWVPGAERHSSFRTLVEQTHGSFVEQLRAERGEPTPRVSPRLGIDAEDRDRLIDALRRPREQDRVDALRGLANLRDPAAVPAVVAILLNAGEDAYVRETAARTLGQLRDARAADALIEILRLRYPGGRLAAPEHRSPAQEAILGLKHAAKQGLLQLGELAEPTLAAALRDPDPLVRAEACATLCYARTRAAAAFDLIAPLRADPDPDVRLALVTHVEQLPDARKRELLLEARRDPVEQVRARAAEALAQLAE